MPKPNGVLKIYIYRKLLTFACFIGLFTGVACNSASSKGAQVIRSYFEALDHKDFQKAYGYCNGKRWGSYQQYIEGYGNITAAVITSLKKQAVSDSIEVYEVASDVKDAKNGDGLFTQLFTVTKMNGDWKITDVKLLNSNRPADQYTKSTAYPDSKADDMERLTAVIYDTAGTPYPADFDTTYEEMNPRIFGPLIPLPGGYMFCVVENRGPFAGVATGWCDVFIFRKKEDKWVINDFMLQANTGGMYGNPGNYDTLIDVGSDTKGIVISGGQTHMGHLFYDDILFVKEGKLNGEVTISTSAVGGTWDDQTESYSHCEENKYTFLKSDKEMYDLQIVDHNCGTGSTTAPQKVIIPYNGGYKIPDAFVFSN